MGLGRTGSVCNSITPSWRLGERAGPYFSVIPSRNLARPRKVGYDFNPGPNNSNSGPPLQLPTGFSLIGLFCVLFCFSFSLAKPTMPGPQDSLVTSGPKMTSPSAKLKYEV